MCKLYVSVRRDREQERERVGHVLSVKRNFVAKTWTRSVDFIFLFTVFICLASVVVGFGCIYVYIHIHTYTVFNEQQNVQLLDISELL